MLGVGDVIQHALVHVTPARIDTSMAPCTACAPAGDAGIDFEVRRQLECRPVCPPPAGPSIPRDLWLQQETE